MEFNRQTYLQKLIDGQGNHLVKVVTGIRRCGKSYLLFNIFNRYLLENDVPSDHIIKIALDTLDNKHLRDAEVLYKYIKEQLTDSKQYYVLLDEIQYVAGFEEVLNSLLHIDNVDVYVTGSNSKFLSSDIITEFRGRGDEIRVQPLSFKEYYQGLGGDKHARLNEYMRFGGLPIVALMENNEKKISYLKEVFDKIYLSDLKQRHKIKNEIEFDELLDILASNVGTLTNAQKLSNTFRSLNKTPINPNTIKNYLDYYTDSFLLSCARRYDVKGKKYISTPAKYYFADVGLRNARINFRQNEPNHIMENIIYNELLCRGFNVDVGVVEIYATNNKGSNVIKQLEVDFVANKGYDRYYIQSAYAFYDESKKQQELASLTNIPDAFERIIVVGDNGLPYRDEHGYKVINIVDFLLEE